MICYFKNYFFNKKEPNNELLNSTIGSYNFLFNIS